MISIVIASSCEHDRTAMETQLAGQGDFCIVCKGKDSFDVLRSAELYRPDIILMGVCKDEISCPDLAPMIKRHSPSTRIMVLCSFAVCRLLNRAVRAGIVGYLSKQDGFGNLVPSIRSVYYGGFYISGTDGLEYAHWLALHVKTFHKDTATLRILTPTELGIVTGIMFGYTDRDIASSLNISIGTLRNSINAVKKKTGLRNRTQIVIHALRSGTIADEN